MIFVIVGRECPDVVLEIGVFAVWGEGETAVVGVALVLVEGADAGQGVVVHQVREEVL